MNSEETVGEYLARAKTLVKSKLKDATAWHHDIEEADTYHVCNRIINTGLKSRMVRRLSQFKTTCKDLFNNIEEEWDQSYFMEDDFASKEDAPTTATDMDEINTWTKTATDDPVEAEILAEVNEVYHCMAGTHRCRYWNAGPRSKNPRAPFRGG